MVLFLPYHWFHMKANDLSTIWGERKFQDQFVIKGYMAPMCSFHRKIGTCSSFLSVKHSSMTGPPANFYTCSSCQPIFHQCIVAICIFLYMPLQKCNAMCQQNVGCSAFIVGIDGLLHFRFSPFSIDIYAWYDQSKALNNGYQLYLPQGINQFILGVPWEYMVVKIPLIICFSLFHFQSLHCISSVAAFLYRGVF